MLSKGKNKIIYMPDIVLNVLKNYQILSLKLPYEKNIIGLLILLILDILRYSEQ